MFPLNWNFPLIKKTGERTTIGDALANAGSTYTLPTASAETKGGVKIGSGLKMTGDTLSNDYQLPTANAETKGGVKVGAGLSIEDGVLSASGGINYRAGENNANIGGGSWNSFNVSFSSPMPNTNYAVLICPDKNGTEFKFSGLTKTVNGFSGRIDNIGSETNAWKVNWFVVSYL